MRQSLHAQTSQNIAPSSMLSEFESSALFFTWTSERPYFAWWDSQNPVH